MSEYKFDVAVIGGGPAGSSSAIHLALAGIEVCIFERKNFPREVLCGEFLSKEVGEEIKKLNLFDKFLLLNPQKIKSFSLKNNNLKELSINFQFEAFSLRRSVFDSFLLEEAKISGVKIFQPVEIKSVLKNKDGYALEGKKGNGERISVKSKFIIAAYGKQNILDKNLHRKFVDQKSNLNGIKFHIDKKYLNNFNSEEIQLYVGNGIYCGINSVNKVDATVCFLYNKKEFVSSPRLQISELMKKNKKFSELFNTGLNSILDELKIYGTGNIYFGKRELVKDGIFMVGDSAGVIAPLAGDGIGMALQGSSILCETLISGIRKNYNIDVIGGNYIDNWNKNFSKRVITARIIQWIIFNNKFRNSCIALVKNIPGLLRLFVKLTRGN
ncbi:MAG: hypothetical protein CO128_06000 [Ignavibacteriales bacterium CG_4_9_14_3_um_filter_30_11]|nr:MAG: hypothetical protein CO128_06000 [Ignavibacteriales bacterium CG_4_9_14_3_um_filter_30_11]